MSRIKNDVKRYAFLVNGKMCVNVSGDDLMCRYDPDRGDEVAERVGFPPMIMKGKQLRGYWLRQPKGIYVKANFEYWFQRCLDFNARTKNHKNKKASAAAKKSS